MIKVCGAKFITSASGLSDSPDFGKSEVAFLGRSNVGKSSFINALVGQKSLAKSSSTPGKTQLVNFFEAEFIENLDENSEKFSLIFVDLPGFGYAKVSKKMHGIWQKNLDEFIKERRNIKLFVHLIDSRQFDLQIDLNLQKYLKSFLRNDQKIIKFYTKSDKLNQSEKAKVLKFNNEAKFISVSKNFGIENARQSIIKGVFGL